MRGRYALRTATGSRSTRRVPARSCSRRAADRCAAARGAGAQIVDRRSRSGASQLELATPLAPGATHRARLRPRDSRTRASATRRRHRRRRQRHLRQRQRRAPVVGYQRARASSATDARPQEIRLGAEGAACAPRDDPRGLRRQRRSRATPTGSPSTRPSAPTRTRSRSRPGYLEREWTRGRAPLLPLPDGRADPELLLVPVRRATRCSSDRWNDVAIEVYYHPGHEYNVDRMIDGDEGGARLLHGSTSVRTSTGRSASSSSRATQTFAQSFPNTIPYSEGIGFIARVRDDDPDDIDYPYYVTAHEVAHQWWGHQVPGADVQGATMLSRRSRSTRR